MVDGSVNEGHQCTKTLSETTFYLSTHFSATASSSILLEKMSKQEGVTAKLETAKLSPTTVKYDLISTRICHCPLILNMSSLPLPKIETLVIAVH